MPLDLRTVHRLCGGEKSGCIHLRPCSDDVLRQERIEEERDMILAIDPGNVESGYALIGDDYKPVEFGKKHNEELLYWMLFKGFDEAVIEMVASYGMPVGETVFQTCLWIGRFTQCLESNGVKVSYVKRKEYVTELCGSSRAKDANVIQYLIDRFAPDTPNRGKGSKSSPGWFYGFKADVWQAYAIGVYWLDRREHGTSRNGE